MQDFLVSGLRKMVEKTAAEFDSALLSATTAIQAVDEWARIERVACAAKLRAAGRAEEAGLDDRESDVRALQCARRDPPFFPVAFGGDSPWRVGSPRGSPLQSKGHRLTRAQRRSGH